MAKNNRQEAREVSPVQLGHLNQQSPEAKDREPIEEPDLDNAVSVTPFQVIQRGEDSLDSDENVTFADFSPAPVPADTPDPLEEIAPKGESAPEPAPSSESTETSEQGKSETTVPLLVVGDDGKLSPSENLKPTSSSDQKNG